MGRLKATMAMMPDLDEAKEVTKSYAALLAALRDFESQQYTGWGQGVEEVSTAKLKQPLLTRDDSTALIALNFDPQLVKLLREVRYFEILHKDIPGAANELNAKAEEFRVQIGNLSLIVSQYNDLLTSALDVEKPLLAPMMKAIDAVLERILEEARSPRGFWRKGPAQQPALTHSMVRAVPGTKPRRPVAFELSAVRALRSASTITT